MPDVFRESINELLKEKKLKDDPFRRFGLKDFFFVDMSPDGLFHIYVNFKDETKKILSEILNFLRKESGEKELTKIIAVVGCSGGGKTTFVAHLADKIMTELNDSLNDDEYNRFTFATILSARGIPKLESDDSSFSITNPNGKGLVVIDDFEELLIEGRNIIDTLKSLNRKFPNSLIIATVLPEAWKRVTKSQILESLFSETVFLSELDEDSFFELFRKRLKNYRTAPVESEYYPFTASSLRGAIDSSRGNPRIAIAIAHSAILNKKETSDIVHKDIEDAVKQLNFRGSTDDLPRGRKRELLRSMLLTGKPIDASYLEKITTKSRSTISLYLNELSAQGILEKIELPGEGRKVFFSMNIYYRYIMEKEIIKDAILEHEKKEITRHIRQ